MKTFFTQRALGGEEKGVALLFVILLTSVLLLVAMGITNIAYKEAAFSSQAKDSDRAFFAADTGIECALYLDGQGHFDGTATGTPSCNGYMPTLADITGTGSYVFAVPLGTQCAEIAVNKNYTASDGSGPYTRLSAIGYNVPANPDALPSACVTTTPNPRVVTRALRTSYLNDGSGTTGTGTTGTGGTTAGDGSISPIVTTVAVLSTDYTTATLAGSLDDMGGASSVGVTFVYNEHTTWTGVGYSSTLPMTYMSATGPYTRTITGLTCGTDYDFAAWAYNGYVDVGSNMMFSTTSCP